MSTQSTAAPVRTQVVVEAPIRRAFDVFTQDMMSWWPADHHLLEGELTEMVFEARAGGRIYDRNADGGEFTWARVLAYEPPDRLVFSWDITPQWQLETDPSRASEVEVRFVAETPQRTRLELEHRNIDRHGPGWQAVAEGVADDAGWPLYLARYAALFTEDR
jgi:uncharacterized protein YndB with AHSA1/START domain